MIKIAEMPNLNIDMKPIKSDYQNIAMTIRELIKRRTRSGNDVNGRQFKGYSEAYKAWRASIGKTTEIVNLENRSEMHNSLSVKATNEYGEIYYSDADRAEVAYKHQIGLGNMPQREHFGLSETEAQSQLKKLTEIISKRIAKQWRSK